MKIFITGGAGYIGSALVSILSELKTVSEILIYDNLSKSSRGLFLGKTFKNSEKIKFVNGDILDSRKLAKEMQGSDWVFHLAAQVTTPFADQHAHLFEQVNHWGTAEVVYAAEKLNLKGFVYLSSTSVYGSSSDEIDHNTHLNPKTFYGISKMRGEEHVARIQGKLPVYILRCGNVYGYSKAMRFDAVINKFLFEAHFQKQIRINGNGNQRRSFISIEKVCLLLGAVLAEELSPNVYNAVSTQLSVLEIGQAVKDLYPDLDMIYVNHHLRLRELRVKPDERLSKFLVDDDFSLRNELLSLQKHFSF